MLVYTVCFSWGFWFTFIRVWFHWEPSFMIHNFIFLEKWVALKRAVRFNCSDYVCTPLVFLLECLFCRSYFDLLTSKTDACQDAVLLRIALMRLKACMLRFSTSWRLSGPASSTMVFYSTTFSRTKPFPNDDRRWNFKEVWRQTVHPCHKWKKKIRDFAIYWQYLFVIFNRFIWLSQF